MEHEELPIDQWNKRMGTDLLPTDTFYEAEEKIQNQEINYFYISMNKDDVVEAIENEPEVSGGVEIVYIQDVGIFLGIY